MRVFKQADYSPEGYPTYFLFLFIGRKIFFINLNASKPMKILDILESLFKEKEKETLYFFVGRLNVKSSQMKKQKINKSVRSSTLLTLIYAK